MLDKLAGPWRICLLGAYGGGGGGTKSRSARLSPRAEEDSTRGHADSLRRTESAV